MTDVVEHEIQAVPEESEAVETWVRVCRIGAGAVFVWSVVLQAVIGTVVPPVIALGVVFGGLALVLAGERRRLAAVTGTLALMAIAGSLPATVDELSHPSSGVAFSLTLLVTLAAILCVLAGLGAVVRWSAAPVRAVVVSAGVVLAAGVVVAVVASSGVTSTSALPDDVGVVAELNRFEPTEISVPAGETGFWLDNRDGIRHTLSLEGTDLEIDAPGYSSQRGVFDLEPGRYTFFCDVPGHESMRIDLAVEAVS